MRNVSVLLGALVIGSGCSGSGDPCLDDPVLNSATASAVDSTAWRAEAAELLSQAPADSVITIFVLVDPRGEAAFREWEASAADVQIRYEFRTVNAFNLTLPIRALAGLLDLDGIPLVDWGTASHYPLC